MSDKKSPKALLIELYEQGVSMRVDENGNLKASHVEDDGLTHKEIAVLRANKQAFKDLLRFDEAAVRSIVRGMYRIVYKRLDQDGRKTTEDYVDSRVETWHESINEALDGKDMGSFRYATRKYAEEALKAISEIQKIDRLEV